MSSRSSSKKIMPSFTAIIQARMKSTRLPGKALLNLGGKPLLYHIIERTLNIEGVTQAVLATGECEENMDIVNLARKTGIETYVGSETNVLERFYMASKIHNADFIIRITGDNPFIDPFYASQTVRIAMENEPDICAIGNLPLGIAVEIIKRTALEDAYAKSFKSYHFEHVTPFLKENSDKYTVERHSVEYYNPFENLRLTVDAPDDYRLARIIYDELYRGHPFPLEEIILFLEQNPRLVDINRTVKQRHMTETNNS